MMLRVYLAGPSRELDRVLPIVASLEQTPGVAIAYAWWRDVQAHGVGKDGELDAEAQRYFASADLRAIRKSDLIWLLWHETSHSNGVPFELGYALGMQKPAIVSGSKASECIFTALVERHVTDAEALERVRVLASAYDPKGYVP
jgi:nucleoside 2-deoxyribosyltransferase